MNVGSRIFLAGAAIAMIGAAPQDQFDYAVNALAHGLRGEVERDDTILKAAAAALDASGAMPSGHEENAARRWEHDTGVQPGPSERNRALGPSYRLVELGGGASAVFHQTFLAGQLARVATASAPGGNFILTVIGEGAKNPVCRVARSDARCDWVPLYTQRFQIEVVNLGAKADRFYLVVQ